MPTERREQIEQIAQSVGRANSSEAALSCSGANPDADELTPWPIYRFVHCTSPGETSSAVPERPRDDIFHGARVAVGGPIPDAASERCDVNHGGIPRVRDHAMAPLEVEALDARPGLASIGRTPRRRFEF